jgi:hypothetical protein
VLASSTAVAFTRAWLFHVSTPGRTFGAVALITPQLTAAVRPNPLFCDHAVLQQNREVPVWGTADEGERVVVEIAGRTAEAVAKDGRWLVRLPELPAGGPYTLTIRGTNTVTFQDVLVGEVWICGGQSNMERQLGPRPGQKPIIGWERETAAANLPQLRDFYVPEVTSAVPLAEVKGSWTVCTPETAPDFPAVGYFFARALMQARGVPVGLIHTAWGGTPAESWTSARTLATLPGFEQTLALLAEQSRDPAGAARRYHESLAQWCRKHDAGTSAATPWSADVLPTDGWTKSEEPGLWEQSGLPDSTASFGCAGSSIFLPRSPLARPRLISVPSTTSTRLGSTASRWVRPAFTARRARIGFRRRASALGATSLPSECWIPVAAAVSGASPRRWCSRPRARPCRSPARGCARSRRRWPRPASRR